MTVRNNEERLGNIQDDSSPEVSAKKAQEQVEENTGNPLDILKMVSPKELVELPTKGRFYPDGHPLKGKETVEIKYMTGVEEDILHNKSYIKKGVVLEKLLKSILVDTSIDPGSLFAVDRTALLLEARKTGFGSQYDSKLLCPSCEQKVDFSFNLDDFKQKDGDEEKIGDNGNLLLTLPKTGVRVICRLITGNDELSINFLNEKKRKHKMVETPLTDMLVMITKSINGVEDRGIIEQFLSRCPLEDRRHLRDEYSKVVPSLETKAHFTCPECEAESEVNVPIGADFFWPK